MQRLTAVCVLPLSVFQAYVASPRSLKHRRQQLHLLVINRCYTNKVQLSREVLLSLFQPYLLVNSLNPVKDLEQPLWISSSSTQKRGNKDGPGAKEEGKEEVDEDAVQSPSSTLTFCNHVPSPSAFVSTLVSSSSPLQASRSVSCSRCGPAPGSESMRESVQVL